MENRLKFRAFDTRENKMYEVKIIYYNNDGSIRGVCEGTREDEGHYIPNCRLVLIQCTGLTDKNGTLIYFSDYIKENGKIYLVFWNTFEISCKLINTNDIIPIAELSPDICEVIGNEFENRKKIIEQHE